MDDRSLDEPTWRPAKRCDNGQCVEIGSLDSAILVRNSAEPDGTCLALSRGEWREFVAGVKDGDFDGL